MSKIKLALLAGGISAEREVSLKTGGLVKNGLDQEKYGVTTYGPRDDLPTLK